MTSKGFGNLLLAVHVTLLLVFLFGKWSHPGRGLGAWLTELRLNELLAPARPLSPRYVAVSMFACNMIGILCLRSMHSQFYAWYQQTMPLILLFARDIPTKHRVGIYLFMEYLANRLPRHIFAVGFLVGHTTLLWISFFKTEYASPYLEEKQKK